MRNACSVLEAVAAEQPVGVSELARITGIDKSAVQRIAVTLYAAGWLHPYSEPPTRWEISPTNPVLRHAARSSLVGLAGPAMEGLRDRSGETVILVTRSDGELVIAAAAESRQPIRLSPDVGYVLSYDGSCTGAAIAAHLPAPELKRLQAVHRSLDDRKLRLVRRRGWAANDGDVAPDVRAVGAAVVAADGYPAGALAICGPAGRVTVHDLPRLGAMVTEAARQVLIDQPGPHR